MLGMTSEELMEELKSGGAYPTGPCSAWPEERHQALTMSAAPARKHAIPVQSRNVKATSKKMLNGLIRTAGQAIRNGKVSAEIRNERYKTCQECPSFIADSKRCSECGCFMEAKTWVNGDKSFLCPLNKWSN